jgi:RimJ/RimL family protein N-acetyltransferase
MIKLIPVDKKDEMHVALLYNLLLERDVSINISHDGQSTMQQHRKFVASHPFRAWYLIEGSGRGNPAVVGAIYITQHNEIGIGIFKEYQRQGWGGSAIRAVMEKHKPLPALPGVRAGCWLANINPQNEHSIKMFTRLGAELRQLTYAF